MRYVLLFLFACSFLSAQENFTISSRLTQLIKFAQTFLDVAQTKKIIFTVGQPRANEIHEQLESALNEYQKQPNYDEDIAREANRVLFKLSNYFYLQSPAKELAEQFEGIVKARSTEWESKTGKHLRSKDIADPVKSTETMSYLQYILSGLGTIEVSNIFAIVPYVLNVGYDKAREFVKKAFLAAGYKEASRLNRRRVARALKKVDYPHDVMVLENPDVDAPYAAVAMLIPPFRVIVLSSLFFNADSFDAFTLYHEIGHLYHDHAIKVQMTGIPGYIAGGFLYLQGAFGLAAYILGIIIIKAIDILLENPYYRLGEREADLFACDQLIKQGRSDLVYAQLDPEQRRSTLEHHELTYQVKPFLTERNPSFPETQLYLRECLKKHDLSEKPQIN